MALITSNIVHAPRLAMFLVATALLFYVLAHCFVLGSKYSRAKPLIDGSHPSRYIVSPARRHHEPGTIFPLYCLAHDLTVVEYVVRQGRIGDRKPVSAYRGPDMPGGYSGGWINHQGLVVVLDRHIGVLSRKRKAAQIFLHIGLRAGKLCRANRIWSGFIAVPTRLVGTIG